MSTCTQETQIKPWPLHFTMAAGGLCALASVVVLSWDHGRIAGVLLVRNTIWLALAWYFASLMFMVQLSPSGWTLRSNHAQMARWCWTWGLVSYLAHFAAAFHFYHGWSHAHAFEHTQKVSGTGEGIYVSYLFTLVWITDTAWWWCHPTSYAARPAWTDRLLHGFMLFIVFNGSIVFASGVI